MDLAKLFKAINDYAEMHTVSHIDSSCLPMKKRVTDAIRNQLKDSICLSNKKKEALVDFISIFSEIATKAATQSNIIHGYIQNGMLDVESHRYPIVHKILSTCQKTIPQEMLSKIVSNFDLFYCLTVEQGRIPEEVFDSLGFPLDENANRKEVLRNCGISQESYQQSKCLTHKYRCNLCMQ